LLLFVLAVAQDEPEPLHRVCCNWGDDNDSDDQHWHILIPEASTTECHHSFMNDREAVLPDYHGWAWEVNSCFLIVQDCNTGCDDGDGNDDDNDDGGGGTNSPLERFSDQLYPAGSPFITNTVVNSHDVNCIYLQVDRTWTSDTVCRAPDPDGRLSDIQVIRLLDTTPPFVGGAPDVTLECYPGILQDIDELAGFPTAYDSCENNIQLSLTTLAASNPCQSTFARTYTTSGTLIPDCALNAVSYTQTITVEDTRPPVVTGVLEYHAECSAVPTTTTPAAVDGCNNIVDPTLQASRVIQGDCSGTYTLLREYAVADICGNSEIHTVVVNVEDTTAPVIRLTGVGSVAPASSVVRTNNNCPPVFLSYEASDNCAEAEEVVFTQDVVIVRSEENRYNYVAQQQLYASDPCGNTDTRVYEFIVEGEPLVTLELDGPNAPVSKTATFAVNVVMGVTNGCPALQNQFIVAVDVGAATLQSVSGAGTGSCTQRANGVVYCENLPATNPLTITLNLSVPSNYLPDSLLLRAVSEYETSGDIVVPAGNDRTALVRFI